MAAAAPRSRNTSNASSILFTACVEQWWRQGLQQCPCCHHSGTSASGHTSPCRHTHARGLRHACTRTRTQPCAHHVQRRVTGAPPCGHAVKVDASAPQNKTACKCVQEACHTPPPTCATAPSNTRFTSWGVRYRRAAGRYAHRARCSPGSSSAMSTVLNCALPSSNWGGRDSWWGVG